MSTVRTCVFASALLFLSAPFFVSAASSASHLQVKPTGEISVTNVTVVQKSGTTLFVRAYWDTTFLRMVITTNASTEIKKNYGEQATIQDVEVGHVLDVEGKLSGGGDSITVVASKIRDTALLREAKSFSGTIKKIEALSQSFVIGDKSLGDVTVVVPPTVPLTQGKRQTTFASLKVGDKALSIVGSYDYATKILTPTSVELAEDKSVFKSQNFQGTLKSVVGTTLPTQIVVAVGGTEYTVYLSGKTSVLNKNKGATTLNRFAGGDTVRFYGAIRETNLSEVDAEVVRDLNF